MATTKRRKRKRKVSKKAKKVTKRPKKKKTRKKQWSTLALKKLHKGLFSKIKQEYFDYDYIEALSPKEKAWLHEFVIEYLGANLDKKNNPDRRIFHNRTKRLRKNCFDMNNARNRDMFSQARAQGILDYGWGNVAETDDNEMSYFSEDEMIDLLDKKLKES